ncbi:MAG TPA: fatty acid desaturase [Gammaproteobacteria bacterium]|nr:fatty acid desaturase [Gammaproteobacteria bacterium]
MTLLNGLFDLPWWGYVLYTVILTQITIAAVTLYLHRSQAHVSLELHPVLSHFFRFWLWLTTGMSTLEWVSIHRKHHAKCETEDDPHSPRFFGIRKVFFQGAELYRKESKNQETLSKYSHGVPNDWLERKLYYGRLSVAGVSLLLPLQVLLVGPIGITIWAIQMIWIPFHAAGGINGIGHYWGYRNYESPDDSTNLTPWAFWIGGEELHNNHHAYPSSAKFSIKPWEFDIGWMYITILRTLGLAKVKKVAPEPVIDAAKRHVDMDTLRAVIRSKMHVMADYANRVIEPVLKKERPKLEQGKALFRQAKHVLIRESSRMNERYRAQLQKTLASSKELQAVYNFRQQLLEIWERTYGSQEKLLQALADWCHRAEQSGIQVLQEFAGNLRGYGLKPA